MIQILFAQIIAQAAGSSSFPFSLEGPITTSTVIGVLAWYVFGRISKLEETVKEKDLENKQLRDRLEESQKECYEKTIALMNNHK